MDRNKLAVDILTDCTPGAMADHKVIAMAILEGRPIDDVLNMKETNDWPETYNFIKAARPHDDDLFDLYYKMFGEQPPLMMLPNHNQAMRDAIESGIKYQRYTDAEWIELLESAARDGELKWGRTYQDKLDEMRDRGLDVDHIYKLSRG